MVKGSEPEMLEKPPGKGVEKSLPSCPESAREKAAFVWSRVHRGLSSSLPGESRGIPGLDGAGEEKGGQRRPRSGRGRVANANSSFGNPWRFEGGAWEIGV